MNAIIKHIDAAPQIGEGIFLIKDVAEILNLPYHKVRSGIIDWDKKFADTNGLYSFGQRLNKAINFYALIEFYIYYQLRDKGISSQKIKSLYIILSRDLQTKYPFAHSKIHTDGKGIWYEQFDNLIKVDGKRQFSFKPILESFLSKIEYGDDNLAKRFFPLKSRRVVIDPAHQFGQPTIAGRNIKIEVIKRLFEGGETKENICNLYELKEHQVADALNYYQRIA